MPADWPDLLGYLAAALVLATFSMRSMVALRIVGLTSNIAFIAYGMQAGLPPVILLHVVLLPLNLLRLGEAARAGFRARRERR